MHQHFKDIPMTNINHVNLPDNNQKLSPIYFSINENNKNNTSNTSIMNDEKINLLEKKETDQTLSQTKFVLNFVRYILILLSAILFITSIIKHEWITNDKQLFDILDMLFLPLPVYVIQYVSYLIISFVIIISKDEVRCGNSNTLYITCSIMLILGLICSFLLTIIIGGKYCTFGIGFICTTGLIIVYLINIIVNIKIYAIFNDELNW